MNSLQVMFSLTLLVLASGSPVKPQQHVHYAMYYPYTGNYSVVACVIGGIDVIEMDTDYNSTKYFEIETDYKQKNAFVFGFSVRDNVLTVTFESFFKYRSVITTTRIMNPDDETVNTSIHSRSDFSFLSTDPVELETPGHSVRVLTLPLNKIKTLKDDIGSIHFQVVFNQILY